MIYFKNMGIEIGDPLLAFGRQLKIAQRGLDIGLDLALEELRKYRDQVGWRLHAKRFVHAGFCKLGEQGIDLAVVERIGHLARLDLN